MSGVVRMGGGVREVSVRGALEWAFGVECAALDFDEYRSDGERPGTDTIWRLMQRGQLGCEIDGGGRSFAHDDADVIASFVAALPQGLGGRGMAVQIAALARAGMVPDCMPDATPRLVPVEWRNTRHGLFAKTEVIGSVVVRSRGREVRHDVTICPVTWSVTAQQVSRARQHYLDWWQALLHLRTRLRAAGLRSLRVGLEMPVLTPWDTTVSEAA